ncbi:MBL fold metallo-hydrolase [Streptomyces litchfieldiae]|uniref:MBL fold metallo-hydrolase n=1 Tax=Streptomyces litchfieldiae TaxID=3075543 RepID=A0ABU2MYY9_9ACTN|nr:MBL fold metallo-hydrolase [Streptomyces sp. DSM 44938]MDT0346013.1 MBL fold metallo-hydrolase [Streptomyces sp. DSM 44938]
MSGSRFGRRGFLRTVTAGTALATTGAAVTGAVPATATATTPAARPATRAGRATFRWLGTSGWRVDTGERTLLIDPFLTRFATGLFDGAFDPATELTVDTEAIAEHAGTPETILVTHAHWDHFSDVPHIAETTGARVVGTATTYNLGLAFGLDSARLSPVKGGEVFDFGDCVVEVIASLHSRNAAYSMAFPGVRTSPPATRPTTIGELPEGDTLAYQVTVKGGPSVFFMGASDFVARNLTGLAPDVAMIAIPSSDAVHDYVPRLLAALDRPATVVPVHWDHFEVPLVNPPRVPDAKTQRYLDAFLAAVRRVAPDTRILLPAYLTPYSFSG